MLIYIFEKKYKEINFILFNIHILISNFYMTFLSLKNLLTMDNDIKVITPMTESNTIEVKNTLFTIPSKVLKLLFSISLKDTIECIN